MEAPSRDGLLCFPSVHKIIYFISSLFLCSFAHRMRFQSQSQSQSQLNGIL